MLFNPKEFLDTFSLPVETRGKWGRTGWIQARCPFCSGSDGFHLGFNLQNEYCNCWRCGWHSLVESIKKLCNCSFHEAQTYIKQFRTLDTPDVEYVEVKTSTNEKIELPNVMPLRNCARTYLEKRKYVVEELEREWDLQQTDNFCENKYRIFAPILYNGLTVSYQCRDYTDRQTPPYKACAEKDEIIHHKHILYGLDKVRGKEVIIVEGIADVWRIGNGACATFGVKYTQEQLTLIIKKFDKVFIWFDPDEAGQENGKKLYYDLEIHGVEVEVINSDEDPGDMDQDEVRKMRKELLGY